MLHSLWLRFSAELAPEEVHDHDIIHFALNELREELANGNALEIQKRLEADIEQIKTRRSHVCEKELKLLGYYFHFGFQDGWKMRRIGRFLDSWSSVFAPAAVAHI